MKSHSQLCEALLQASLGLLIISVVFMLAGCSANQLYGKSAIEIRAGLDECHENKLLVLLYVMPDHAIYAIRCFPAPDEVSQKVMVRTKTPINLLRPFMEKETIIIEKSP